MCILTGTATLPDANTDMTFIIDDNTFPPFEKAPDGDSTYHFNQTVFSATNLSNTLHTLQIQSGHANNKALVLLDAVIYTMDDGFNDSGNGDSGESSSSASLSFTNGASGASNAFTTISTTATSLSGKSTQSHAGVVA